VIVVADHGKLGVVANFVTALLKQVDALVTDEGFDDGYRAGPEELGAKIIIAPHDSTSPSNW